MFIVNEGKMNLQQFKMAIFAINMIVSILFPFEIGLIYTSFLEYLIQISDIIVIRKK